MKTTLRIFWIFTLLMFTAGCGSHRMKKYSYAEVVPENQAEPGNPTLMVPGDQVRLHLVDGNTVEGKVELVSTREIVLDPEGNSLQPRGFSAAQVESVEFVPKEYISARGITIGAGALIVIGGIVLAVVASSISVAFE